MPYNLSANTEEEWDAHIGIQRPSPVGGAVKRGFDIVFSAVSLIALLPLFLIIALLLQIYGKGPVFFVHERVGFQGKTFKCLKFRTMIANADARLEEMLSQNAALRDEFERTRKLREDPRIIPVMGSFLRMSSLDELPQLMNVLLGSMSLVGPRPVTRIEFERYGTAKREYQSTRPGLTGLWQVSGRNDLSFADRVAIDTNYVASWTLWRDLTIILKTFDVVYHRRGAY